MEAEELERIVGFRVSMVGKYAFFLPYLAHPETYEKMRDEAILRLRKAGIRASKLGYDLILIDIDID